MHCRLFAVKDDKSAISSFLLPRLVPDKAHVQNLTYQKCQGHEVHGRGRVSSENDCLTRILTLRPYQKVTVLAPSDDLLAIGTTNNEARFSDIACQLKLMYNKRFTYYIIPH
jgi:hypothetical protein